MNVKVDTTATRIGNEVFEGDLVIQVNGDEGPRKTFSWSVVNRIPGREPSLNITHLDGKSFIPMVGVIDTNVVEALPSEKKVFFYLAVPEINEAIRALELANQSVGRAQMAGSTRGGDFALAGIKERPTGEVGDTAYRVFQAEVVGDNARLLLEAILIP